MQLQQWFSSAAATLPCICAVLWLCWLDWVFEGRTIPTWLFRVWTVFRQSVFISTDITHLGCDLIPTQGNDGDSWSGHPSPSLMCGHRTHCELQRVMLCWLMIRLALTSVNVTNSCENTNANNQDFYVVLIHWWLQITAKLPCCISSSDFTVSGQIQLEQVFWCSFYFDCQSSPSKNDQI